MKRSATIRDVAKRADVGIGTVSRVLNDSPAVSPATRQRVLAAIQELNFSPNPAARRLSLGKSLTIGVIVPFFTNPSVIDRMRGIEAVVAESHYDLVLFNVETQARRDACFHDVPRSERMDGVLIISLHLESRDARRFIESQVPTVLIDAVHPDFDWVIVDNVAGGYLATQHLIQLGHRRIAYISDELDQPFESAPVKDRYQGYVKALTEANIPLKSEYYRQGELKTAVARQLAHELLDQPQPPTAIFAYSDIQAIGVLEAAEERGINVPRDLSVIGYDDIEIAEYLGLTTIRQSLFESGARGAELLLKAMTQPTSERQQVMLPTELVNRKTTGRLLNNAGRLNDEAI